MEAELEGDEDEEFGRDQIFTVHAKHCLDFLQQIDRVGEEFDILKWPSKGPQHFCSPNMGNFTNIFN